MEKTKNVPNHQPVKLVNKNGYNNYVSVDIFMGFNHGEFITTYQAKKNQWPFQDPKVGATSHLSILEISHCLTLWLFNIAIENHHF